MLWRTVSEKFSFHLSSFNLTSIDLRLYKHLQWHCFNWPILRLCTHVHGQSGHKSRNKLKGWNISVCSNIIHTLKQETPTFCAEMSFPRKGCIWLSLEGGRKFKSVTNLQTSVLVRHIELNTHTHIVSAVPLQGHWRPVHADAVHAGVVRVSPVGQDLQLNDLEGLPRPLLYVTTQTGVRLLHTVSSAPYIIIYNFLPIISRQTVNMWNHPIGNTLNVNVRWKEVRKSNSHFGSCCCVVAC